MSDAAMAMRSEAAVTRTQLGWKFIRWGLGLFITGFLTGFIPILHYMTGAITADVGAAFLKNITLWWGCPAILAELTLKTGSLGMIAVGFCHLAIARQGAAPDLSGHERSALTLCAYGLIAELVTAGVGYVACNLIWPNFYYHAIPAGKNAWLAIQGLSVLVYVIGIFYAVAGIRRATR